MTTSPSSPPPSAPPAGDPQPPPPDASRLRLSIALCRILEQDGAARITLGHIIDVTGERAFAVLMAFLCLPFLQPIPLPGVSIPFGLTIMLLSLQMAIRNNRPWLPRRMRQWRLPPRFAAPLLRGVAKLFNPLEKIIKPRLLFMQNGVIISLIGACLMIDGALLAFLPPIPGSNLIPAWMAMIKILGLTEEDGLLLILGLLVEASAVGAVVLGLVFGFDGVMGLFHAA